MYVLDTPNELAIVFPDGTSDIVKINYYDPSSTSYDGQEAVYVETVDTSTISASRNPQAKWWCAVAAAAGGLIWGAIGEVGADYVFRGKAGPWGWRLGSAFGAAVYGGLCGFFFK
jgi:outer membrane lipoprotein SlyB